AADLSDVKALSAEAGFKTLREVLEQDAGLLKTAATDAMIALNAAMATDGVVLSIADGAQLSAPIQILHIATAASATAFTRS
ncbi:hypothetical protein ACP3WZ_25935, partial [Salmonella enterica]